MKDISEVMIETIDKIVSERGYSLYASGTNSGKFLVLDQFWNTILKLDTSFSEGSFCCTLLVNKNGELKMEDSVNIAWTDAQSLRNFIQAIRDVLSEKHDDTE